MQVQLNEWESVDPTTQPMLQGYCFQTKGARSLARQLTSEGKLELREAPEGRTIRATSFVGRISIGDLIVSVVPKVAPQELLALFRYAYGLNDLKLLHSTDHSTGGTLFSDLLISQLYSEVRNLLDSSLAKTYERKQESLSAPRGKIDFSRLATQGGLSSARLPCTHFERATDNLLNQVVLAGLQLAAELADARELKVALRRQKARLSEFARSVPLSFALLRRAQRQVNRLTEPYRSLLCLVELLFSGKFLTLEGARETEPLPGFLFDMNRFFQELLSRFLSENLRGYELKSERGLGDMMSYVKNPKGRKAPCPRPDYTILKDGKVLALLDAKYRDLWQRSLPRDVLYQLAIYTLSQPRGSTSTILYPAAASDASDAKIKIADPHTGHAAAYVQLRPVHLTSFKALIEATGPEAVKARHEAAHRLAGVH